MDKIQELIVASCISRQSIYDGLVKIGLTRDMLSGRPQEIFDLITKYRIEHEVDEIQIVSLPMESALKIEILKWMEDVLPSAYAQYYEALERDFIGREKSRIIRETGATRLDCMEAAIQLIRLAERGSLEEEDLSSQVERTKQEIAKRQDVNYKNPFAIPNMPSFLGLGHYEPGSLVTLGGGSGHGKSTFALNLVNEWLNNDISVIYFSNEMTEVVLLTKLLCIKYGFEWQKLTNSKGERILEEELPRIMALLDEFKSKSIRIFTKPYSLDRMSLIIRTYKPKIFILDTINALISAGDDDRRDIALGDMAREMKRLAEETNSLGIVVAQLRDVNGRPTDKNLVKESRQIRDASDYMDFIYREFEQRPHSQWEQLRSVFEIYRVKGRYTGQGDAKMKINTKTGQITEFSSSESIMINAFFKQNQKRLYRESNG